ncbi:MAG: DUF1837 domain-containing protein [Bacteroidota bacterium]|uniref:HamA C-terminal domain-containing protein n=1 Tax=Capnocytophaga stomatis TaxID=1848904 RepID=UPI001A400883|nr:DUF1837 domain-containing protein [Capnocytophaga stomatis]MDO4729237.1 DUF1837 domain-containing protein [Bacteroidota bacterium]GIJ94075.1 hypothetical protein CAPN002_12930 [Capnocytophaga stomatis]
MFKEKDFEILFNDDFLSFRSDESFIPIGNERVLSIINDFEDGNWRYNKFQNFIWNNIKETALSYKERKALIGKESNVLENSAKNLRLVESGNAKGSEIGEIVLYGIMKDYYDALPIVPKIFYKQNKNDEAKGADSVHIVVEGEDQFSLWLGEAKFYNDISNVRLDEIIKSVKNSICSDKIRKENSIITNISDIDYLEEISDQLKQKIKKSLSEDISIDTIKPILNIPILLLYQCDITSKCKTMSEEYKKDILSHQKERATGYFKKQIEICKDIHLYDKIRFHIIFFPIANKENIVNKFIQRAKVFRD